jgi:putative metallohydrolase (TIGR04338 family)
MPARDKHRKRVYAAEESCPLLNLYQRFTPAQAQYWVHRWSNSAWAKKLWSRKTRRFTPVRLNKRLTAYRGEAYANGIWLGVYGGCECKYVVIHELAHVFDSREHPRMAAHGPTFRSTLLALTANILGREAAQQLIEAFENKRVPAVKVRERITC